MILSVKQSPSIIRFPHTLPLTTMIRIRLVFPYVLIVFASIIFTQPLLQSKELDSQVIHLYQSQIPKTEIGALAFLQEHPAYDGRGTIIAIFDTGVDPGAPGMLVTTTGERKIVDIIDGSGSGDVDVSKVVKIEKDGTIQGFTGRKLFLPEGIKNPTGDYHLGVKYGKELFHEDVWDRVVKWRKQRLSARIQESKVQRLLAKQQSTEAVVEEEKDSRAILDEKTLETELEKVEASLLEDDPGPYFDCVVWNDGENWRVIVDTDEDGDLTDEMILKPFGIAGDYASFPDHVALNFGVQVYHDGRLLSIVTTSGSHGTHVASIAAGYFLQNTDLNGVAPGAKILSVKMGDIRTGGSSVYIGENRAVATAAQYDVDIMNASWGGQSIYQDGSGWGIQLYNTLVEKYGVTAFVSAGNDGPAISTMGSPGGEATSVIGVGAYISPEMGELLYSVIEKTPETMFMFSARGPTRNGDRGVDIVAPGAAITSLALDSLNGSNLYNGTSMSSPSAAGVGALLISAAKQSGIHYSPARIRYALMNSAKFLDKESALAQGNGLIQTLSAWEHLNQFQDIEELDVFYEVDMRGGRYQDGPGLYLRGNLPQDNKSFLLTISPKFPDKYSNRDQYAFNTQLSLKTDQPWVKVPDFLHLSNAGNSLRPEIDFKALAQTDTNLNLASIDLFLAEHPEAGPIIQIPITIIEGEHTQEEGNALPEFTLELNASLTFRKFLTSPPGAQHLTIELTREKDDNLEKLFVINAITLVANQDIEAFELKKYFRLKSGASETFEIPVVAGEVMELAIHQVWSYDKPTSLSCAGQWKGLDTVKQLYMAGGGRTTEMTLKSLNDAEYEVSAVIDQIAYIHFPTGLEVFPGDKRGYYPAGRTESTGNQSFWLKQQFDIELKEDRDVWFDGIEYVTEFKGGGGILEIYDDKEILVEFSFTPGEKEDAVHLPKGHYKIFREYTAHNTKPLDLLKKTPLIMMTDIDPVSLNTYSGHLSLVSRSASTELSMKEKQELSLFITPPSEDPFESLENKPDYAKGRITFTQDNIEQAKTDLFYSSAAFYKEPEGENNPPALEGMSNLIKELSDAVYKQQLKFLKQSRTSTLPTVVDNRNRLLKILEKARKSDPQLWLEEVYGIGYSKGLIHPWIINEEGSLPTKKDSKDSNDLLKRIKGLIGKCEPGKVAQYIGAPPLADLPDSPEAKKIEKDTESYEKLRAYIAEAYLLAVDINLVAEHLPEARILLNEAKRWQVKEEKELIQQKLEIQLLKQEGYTGLALEIISKTLEENPSDSLLLEWKNEIHQSLGWNEFNPFNELLENLTEHADKLR